MIGELAGTVVWIMANVMYVQYRRDGLRGFRRFAAFWLGFPITLFSALAMSKVLGISEPPPERRRQRRRQRLKEAREDEEAERELLAEIRRDRAARRLASGDTDDIDSSTV